MKIRLEGTRQECDQAAEAIGRVVDVLSVSRPYPWRGNTAMVRIYLEARLRDPAAEIRRAGHRAPAGNVELS